MFLSFNIIFLKALGSVRSEVPLLTAQCMKGQPIYALLFSAPWLRSDGNACIIATATAISLTALVCFERIILVSSIFYDDDDICMCV